MCHKLWDHSNEQPPSASQHTTPCFKAASYRPGGKALNNPREVLWSLISCLHNFPPAAAWTKPVDKAGTFRAASPATYAAKAHRYSFCVISPLARPSSPMPPAFLSHNPENAFFFFFLLKAAPLFLAGWAEQQAAQCKCPFLRMYVGHPRAGKCLRWGFLSKLPSAPHFPSPFPADSHADPGCPITSHPW